MDNHLAFVAGAAIVLGHTGCLALRSRGLKVVSGRPEVLRSLDSEGRGSVVGGQIAVMRRGRMQDGEERMTTVPC